MRGLINPQIFDVFQWMTMTWQSQVFLFLFLVFLVYAYQFLFRKQKAEGTLYVPFPVKETKKLSTWRSRFSRAPLVLKLLALGFVILALARPQTANTKSNKNVEGIDIVIVLDVSDSMLIEDMRPENRLESAKMTIKKFIEKRSSDKIGMTIFAGEAFTLIPPTLDYPLILDRLKDIQTAAKARIKDGTALGVAMASGAARLKESKAKNRVMIFLTDGENNSGTIDPETGLSIVKSFGIKIYSIGIGKDGPTRIPIYRKDPFGNQVKTYQPFESTVNEDLLRRMAQETSGKYFRASKEDSLVGVFNEIDSLEKTKIETTNYIQYAEKFPGFLWMAFYLSLAVLLLESFVFRRRQL